ncbi:MAG: AEC family transporter [Candidatus Omnitrophota bacterium]
MFEANFQAILAAPLRMFLMGAAGYYFVRRGVVTESVLSALNDLLIYLFLPCLIFHDFLSKFTFSAYGNWWIFPLLGVAVSLAGLVVGEMLSFLLKNKEKKNQFLSLCAFQNSGYIPLLIAEVILKPQDASQMYMYIFLFLVGFNFLIWSLGVKLISEKDRGIVSLKDFYNPPILATIVSLGLIFFGFHRFIPQIVMASFDSFGSCTMPLAILVVGGSLATIKIHEKRYLLDVFLAVLAKIVVFPALVLAALFFLQVKSMLGLLLVIQAAAPSAVTLTVIAKYYKKEETFINQTIFYSHVLGLIMFPIFLILYQTMAG